MSDRLVVNKLYLPWEAGDVMADKRAGLQNEWSGFESLPGTLCCVQWQDTFRAQNNGRSPDNVRPR